VLARMYAAELSPSGEEAEMAVELCGMDEISRSATRDVFDTLAGGGFDPVVSEYQSLFIDKATRIDDESTPPSSLAALHRAGNADATARLIELAEGESPLRVLGSLAAVGAQEYVYGRASELHKVTPSRSALKHMLSAKFTTQQWQELWALPIDFARELGDSIYYRANDVRQLAEHLTGSEIHFEPQS
jgi:hypothetical protein